MAVIQVPLTDEVAGLLAHLASHDDIPAEVCASTIITDQVLRHFSALPLPVVDEPLFELD